MRNFLVTLKANEESPETYVRVQADAVGFAGEHPVFVIAGDIVAVDLEGKVAGIADLDAFLPNIVPCDASGNPFTAAE